MNSRLLNALLLILCCGLLAVVRFHVNNPITGDEPHYLVVDYALVHDHTFNLKSAYAKDAYLSFYPQRGLLPQGNPSLLYRNPEKVYTPHGIGLPLLLVPGYFLKSHVGAIFEMVLVSTLVVYLTWVWTRLVTKSTTAAYAASSALVLCYFFNGLAGYIYPDMAIAAVSLGLLIVLEGTYKKRSYQLLFGALLGFLVLLHYRNLDIAIPALAVLAYKQWRAEHKAAWLPTAILLLFIACYFMTIYHWFGVLNPSIIFSQNDESLGINPFGRMTAMLFDSNRGLLVYNPLLLLLFVGLPLWFSKHRESFLVTLFTLGPSVAVLCLFSGWNGGTSPAGRYIIDFLPAFMPALGLAFVKLRQRWQRLVMAVLAFITLLITLDAAITKFPLINPVVLFVRSPLFTQIQQHTGLALDHLLPTYSTRTFTTTLLSSHGLLKIAICYLLVLGLIAYGCYQSGAVRKKIQLKH